MSLQKENRVKGGLDKRKALHEFCENSTIHGVKYIFHDDSHFVERLIWLLVFLGSTCFSIYFCWLMWTKWEESPVITSVETQLYPLKNIAFPAVTICNVNKVSERKLNRTLARNRKFNNVPASTIQSTLSYMTKLDRGIDNKEELLQLDRFYQALNISALDLFTVLQETAPSCSDIIMDCNWLGLTEPCMQYFSFLPTDDGMCCTFNGGKYNDEVLGIENNAGGEPLRVNGNGYRMGLSLVIDADVQDYSVTNGKFEGFKILVHSPQEFPDVADRGFVVGPGTETFVAVKATTSFNTEEVARRVSSTKRQCLVEGEKELKYFQRYSQSACITECATHVMQGRCQCRPYFLKAGNHTRICEMKSYTCISDAYEEVRLHGDTICGCLPPCSDTWYEPEISYASFPGAGFTKTRTFKRLVARRNLSADTASDQYFKSNVAMLHVYYKEKTGMRYITDIRFGVEDFIAAMGALWGLGLGVSFISVFEIIYFLFRHIFVCRRSSQPNSGSNLNQVL